MRFEIQLRIVADDGVVIEDRKILALDKANDRIEAIGLSLGEAKSLLGRLQQQLVEGPGGEFRRWAALLP
jgi:hypothetical protein